MYIAAYVLFKDILGYLTNGNECKNKNNMVLWEFIYIECSEESCNKRGCKPGMRNRILVTCYRRLPSNVDTFTT